MVGAATRAVAGELRAVVARRGIGQASLAEASGVAQATLSKILRGVAPIDVEQVYAICNALGVEPSDVLEAASREGRSSAPRLRLVRPPLTDAEIDAMITLAPAASDPEDGYDPDAEVEAQQDEP